MESQSIDNCKEIFYVFKETKTKDLLCTHKDCQGKSYKHQNKMFAHLRTHFGFKPFKCPHCSKSFNEKGNLKTHIRIHTGERPFKCDKCTKAFKAFGQLKDHQMTHLGLKPFECNICHKQYRRKEILKNHLLIHNKEAKCSPVPTVLSSTTLCSAENSSFISTPFTLFDLQEEKLFMFPDENVDEGILFMNENDNNDNCLFDFNMNEYNQSYL